MRRTGLRQWNLQREKMGLADQRVRQTSEMVQGAKLVKLYAWEIPLVRPARPWLLR